MALREAMVVSFTLFEFPCDMPKSSKGVIGDVGEMVSGDIEDWMCGMPFLCV